MKRLFVVLTLFIVMLSSCATKMKGYVDFSQIPESKYEIEQRRKLEEERRALEEKKRLEEQRRQEEAERKRIEAEKKELERKRIEAEKKELERNKDISDVESNVENNVESDEIKLDEIKSDEIKTSSDDTNSESKNKISDVVLHQPNNDKSDEESVETVTEVVTPDVTESSNSATGYKEVSLLFLPLKDTGISISLLSSRIRGFFAYDMPDCIAFTGANEKQQNDLASFFGDYKAFKGEDSIILLKDLSAQEPLFPPSTKILTFTTKEEYNEEDLNLKYRIDPLYPNEYESLYNNIELYKNTPVVLLLSPNERSPQDFSSWSSPTRYEAESRWQIISTLTDNNYYDAIENTRWNSSSSGPLYSDWTYKSDNNEMRLDFMMLKDVAVEDVFTIDIADYSLLTTPGIRRRGIYAHLIVEDSEII